VTLDAHTRPAYGEPEGVLVLLHGRGADELDLVPLLDLLDPRRRLLALTPRGPFSFPPGGAHWYALREVGYPDPPTFHDTFGRLAEWLDGLAFPPERTALGGFSQGAVMSYALALAKGRPSPAALVALSGFIPTVPDFEFDLESRAGLPVAIAHGAYDPVIGVEWGRRAAAALEPAGPDVVYRELPLPHAVDPHFVSELAPWLEAAMARARSRTPGPAYPADARSPSA
jgi:phospholipase/carboxylesterase